MSAALAIFAASLLGSVHCAGMCGGFVCFYAAESRVTPIAHAAYNLGRLASYLALGALAALLGVGANKAGTLVGISYAAAVLSGILMVAWGAAALVRSTRGRKAVLAKTSAGLSVALLARARRWPVVPRALATGLITTLLPCGWLYAFVAAAAGTGSLWGAWLVMFLFWLGTIPAMVMVGMTVRKVAGPLRQRLPVLTAVAVMLIGLMSIAGKLRPGAVQHAVNGASAKSVVPGNHVAH